MARLLKASTKVLGMHPGALVYIKDSGAVETVTIKLMSYHKADCLESDSATFEECVAEAKKDTCVTWVEFEGLSNNQIIQEIGNQFGIHRLWLEDILNMDHRSKIEEIDNMLFAIIKLVSLSEKKGKLRVETSQVSLCFGEHFVLSFHDNADNEFDPLKKRIRESIWKIRTLKSDYLFYALMDLIIDQYYPILEKMEDAYEDLEDNVTENINKVKPIDILSLKGNFLYLKKNIFPMKEALAKIISMNHPWIEKHNLKYFKDLQDHIIQIIEVIDYYNELTMSLMDFYQNAINQRTNEVMKVLTLFAAIFIPLTFVVGIYGMNFKFMPELDWRYGYMFVWLVIGVLSVSMFLFFKKKKWF